MGGGSHSTQGRTGQVPDPKSPLRAGGVARLESNCGASSAGARCATRYSTAVRSLRRSGMPLRCLRRRTVEATYWALPVPSVSLESSCCCGDRHYKGVAPSSLMIRSASAFATTTQGECSAVIGGSGFLNTPKRSSGMRKCSASMMKSCTKLKN